MANSFDKALMGAAAGGGGPSDDEFNRVSFLSHFEGSNNGVNNAFDDSSTSNHTITANGNVTQGSFGPFARPDGEWGVDFDGTGDYLTVAASNDFDISDGDITIEGFFNFTSDAEISALWTFTTNSSDANGVRFLRFSDGYLTLSVRKDSSYLLDILDDTIPIPLNTWHHIAVTRTSGGAWKVYVNGVIAISGTESASSPSTAGLPLSIGANYQGTDRVMNGYISNFRLVKGTLVYTSNNFTPPTSKLTAITNTKLLTCQSNRFVDNSASGHTVTPSGGAAVSAFGPFLTSRVYDPAVNGASAFFDGSDDLTIPNSSDFNLSNNPFTFSFWANFSDGGTLYGRYNYPSSQRETFISTDDDGTIRMRISSNGTGYSDHATASGVFVFNQWNYIVITRTISGSNSVFKTYVNGTLSKTTTISFTTIYNANQSTYIMNYGPIADRPTGYLCDFKLVSGTATAADSSNPTAPATNTTNTKLLLNMADGQAIDSTSQNNLTLYGTAKTSTAQKKFGTASLLLDGNSDFLTFPHSESNDISGAGNWTVEFFWRFVDNNATQYQEIATKGSGFQIYGDNGALSIALSANNTTTYFLSANNGTTLSDNTWYHIAAVKNGTAYNVYLNGTNEANLDVTSSSNVDTGTDPWCLGAYTSNSYYANGYMDEFRISKFARYTSNFTAPTEPFADKGQ